MFEQKFAFLLVVFCQRKFFELYVRTCPAVFLLRGLHRWFLPPDFLELAFSLTSVTSTALQLQFVSVTSFLLLSQKKECRFLFMDF